MTEFQEPVYTSTTAGTPRWVGLAVIVLAIASIAGVGLGVDQPRRDRLRLDLAASQKQRNQNRQRKALAMRSSCWKPGEHAVSEVVVDAAAGYLPSCLTRTYGRGRPSPCQEGRTTVTLSASDERFRSEGTDPAPPTRRKGDRTWIGATS